MSANHAKFCVLNACQVAKRKTHTTKIIEINAGETKMGGGLEVEVLLSNDMSVK